MPGHLAQVSRCCLACSFEAQVSIGVLGHNSFIGGFHEVSSAFFLGQEGMTAKLS
jgi:hypothetical protein